MIRPYEWGQFLSVRTIFQTESNFFIRYNIEVEYKKRHLNNVIIKKTDHNYIKKDYEIKNDIYLNNELINIVF